MIKILKDIYIGEHMYTKGDTLSIGEGVSEEDAKALINAKRAEMVDKELQDKTTEEMNSKELADYIVSNDILSEQELCSKLLLFIPEDTNSDDITTLSKKEIIAKADELGLDIENKHNLNKTDLVAAFKDAMINKNT